MNATSSRAHTVVTITFDQIIKNESGSETKKSSTMNLVDLAGSERADSTGATGDRLKEGANINRSLSALGNVISALADLSMGKKKIMVPYRDSVLTKLLQNALGGNSKKKIMVPYRDSVLTKLLQNALGGNSKTVMIAALSPADINYDETLSTLRYADRAKKIQNKAVINENPLDKLIRELKEENEKLKKAMEAGGTLAQEHQGLSPEDIEKMRRQMEDEIRAQLLANQHIMAESAESWEAKLAAAQSETEAIETQGDISKRKNEPRLVNLNEDPMLSGVIRHFLEEGETTVGRKDATPQPDLCLSGLSIQKQHAVIYKSKKVVELEPVSAAGAKTKVNGLPLVGKKTLQHKDRVLFGSNHLYVFLNPLKPDGADDLPVEITWEFAQKEIAHVKGFDTASSIGLTKEQQIAQEQVLEILPMVSEVNAVSEEINKHKSFEVVLISAAAQEEEFGSQTGTKVMVKMKNLLNGNIWLWERGKFMNRRYLIQDMYQQFLGGEDISNIPKEEDPFWEPADTVLIGTANVFLQSLSYALDFDDKLAVTDYKGQEEGYLWIHLTPCTQAGKPLEEDYFVEDPHELLQKPFHFKVEIKMAEAHKAKYSKGLQVKYRVFKEVEFTATPVLRDTLQPEFNHARIIAIPHITQDHLDFFESGCITFLVYGRQVDTEPDPKLLKLTTRELRQMEHVENPTAARRNTIFCLENASDQSHLKTELVLLQRKYERLAQKEHRMQASFSQVCEEWSKKPAEEQQYDAFYRTVSAVAYSTGTRLKTRVQILNSDKSAPDDGDTVSLFVFGEEELELAAEADRNGGLVRYNRVAKHHCPDIGHWKQHSSNNVIGSSTKNGQVGRNGSKESSTCSVQ
ncbi:hypothetical protein ScPMuIL_001005 [Solemya velum]